MRLPRPGRDGPPPGPFRATFWRSPLRGPWLTAFLGRLLLFGIPIVAVTGFLSNAAYYPRLGGNAVGRPLGPLDIYLFSFPTHPAWLYGLNQGLHVTIGLAVFPILLAKLWSVIPKLFEWPPTRGPAHALERLSLAFLVGGALFEFATGILNIQYAYLFGFFFTTAHFYGAWVFTGAFLFHVVLKFPIMRRSLAARRDMSLLRDGLADTRPEPAGDLGSSLVAVRPAPATMSRRALLGTIGAGSLFLLIQGAGQSIGGGLRTLAFLAPRGQTRAGPDGFPINRTATAAQITPRMIGVAWRLELTAGKRTAKLSRAQIRAMTQHAYDLPIACVEGWTTTQHWTGVPLRDLARLVGVHGSFTVTTRSLATNGVYDRATLGSEQTSDQRTMLALQVNGGDLSLDHGYPARLIGPAIPGVHCTKWVHAMTFEAV